MRSDRILLRINVVMTIGLVQVFPCFLTEDASILTLQTRDGAEQCSRCGHQVQLKTCKQNMSLLAYVQKKELAHVKIRA